MTVGDEVKAEEYQCSDCGHVFADPDVEKDADEDACPECGSFDFDIFEDDDQIAICPECQGYAAADNGKPEWRCVEHSGIWIGCGWAGNEPDYRERTEEDEEF